MPGGDPRDEGGADFVDEKTDGECGAPRQVDTSGLEESDLPELTLGDPEPIPPAGDALGALEKTAEIPTAGLAGAKQADLSPRPPTRSRRMAIREGGVLGPYDLIEQIGEGGMATIFRAKDSRNGQIVAVKALHAHQTKGLAGKRFQREFRHIQRLNHPNIVTVMDYAEEQGQPYIVMEFVDGYDVKAYLKPLRALPLEARWREVERLIIEVCRALEHVHSRKLIHRDLKPSNILLNKDKKVKLTDFGVVKPQDASVQLTQAGMLVGTLAYLAPEVFEQTKIDHRLDLYALGVVLYVMLANRLPFSGKNISQIMQKHLQSNPRLPRDINPDAPEHLERIALRLLSKKASDRYQSAAEVIRAIEQYRDAARQAELLEPEISDLMWRPRVVGRSAELGLFRRITAALSRGKGALVLVEGGEGVGKSRLVEAGLGYARSLGIAFYAGRCLSGGQSWGEGFRGVVDGVLAELERVGGAPEPLPRLRKHFGEEDSPAPIAGPEPPGYDFERDMAGLFLHLTLKSPRIVWVDDLERADPGTLQAICKLSRKLVQIGAPLVVVGTVATGRKTPGELLQRVLDGGTPGLTPVRMMLHPLKLPDIQALLEQMLEGDARVGPLAERLLKESRGWPLVIVELMRLLIAQGRIGLRMIDGQRRWVSSLSLNDIEKGLRLPGGLRSQLKARLSAYPNQTRTLMRLIAVWGREIRFRTLLRLASAPEEALSAHIDRLLADGWLVEDWTGGEEAYHLAHPSYRAVLLSELTQVEKSRLRGFIDVRLRRSRT